MILKCPALGLRELTFPSKLRFKWNNLLSFDSYSDCFDDIYIRYINNESVETLIFFEEKKILFDSEVVKESGLI
jgi:hypothetical protein